MSHFYGTLKGARGEATRCGSKNSGLRVVAASWKGAIEVLLYEDDGVDKFVITEIPWRGAGVRRTIAMGALGKPEETQ